jgi:hypothetical protein
MQIILSTSLLAFISLSVIDFSSVYNLHCKQQQRQEQQQQKQKQKLFVEQGIPHRFKRLSLKSIDSPTPSRVSCVLETFNQSVLSTRAPLHSCKYDFLCFDINKYQFVLFPSVNHYKLISMVHSSIYLSSISKPILTSTISASNHNTTLIKPMYSKFRKKDMHHVILDEIEDNFWIPLQIFDSFKSVLLDIYFPIYSLLDTFDLTSMPFQIFLLNASNTALQRIHDFSDSMQLPRLKIISFLPVTEVGNLTINEYICFSHAVMGIGGHGSGRYPRPRDVANEHRSPPEHMHRGGTIQSFRQYLIQKMEISNHSLRSFDLIHSSQVSWVDILQNYTNFSTAELTPTIPLREKVLMILKTKILLLASDEDKTVALFLPPKSHLIILGLPNSDWDIWTNCAWIQTHNININISKAIRYIIDEAMHEKLLQHENTKPEEKGTVQLSYNHNISLIHQPPPSTRIHCIGEKLYPTNIGAPHFRSCLFQNLCFDLKTKNVVIFPSPAYLRLLTQQKYLMKPGNYFSTISLPLVVSPFMKSALNIIHKNFTIHIAGEVPSKHYRFQGTWIPLDTAFACNPGRLISFMLNIQKIHHSDIFSFHVNRSPDVGLLGSSVCITKKIWYHKQ